MDAKTLISCLEILPPSQAVLIRGHRGIGKSQIVRSLSVSQNKPLIDVRASTMQEGDAVGYPNLEMIKETGVACFALPSWYARACREGVVLFLDELNRGLIGVLNGMFQIVLDRELGNNSEGIPTRLHPDTQVIAAVNIGNEYTVNEMDPALLSRFWVADFLPSVADWIDWAKSNNINEMIVEFISNHPEHLRATKPVEGDKKTPDQRAWELFGIAIEKAGLDLFSFDGNPPAILYSLASGFVGVEAAAAFTEFVKRYENNFTAADVLDKWSKSSKSIKKLSTERHLALIEKIKNNCIEDDWSLSQVNNLHKFFKTLTGELKMNLYNAVLSTSKTSNIQMLHSHVSREIMELINAAQAASKKS